MDTKSAWSFTADTQSAAGRVPSREQFEQWILSRGEFGIARKGNGQYRNDYVRGAWAMRCAILMEFKT